MPDGTLPDTTVPSGLDLPSDVLQQVPEGAIILEHKPVAFPNYPYEWPPEMLRSAAELTLRLAQSASAAGFTLKDATPYNIMFEGPKPVFIDILSFAASDPLDAVWRPYAQFVRTFVYPLLASRYFGLRPDELLLVHRDGLEPERMLRLCPLWRLMAPPFLGSVTIPAILSRHADTAAPDRFRARHAKSRGEAKFLLGRLFQRAERLLPRRSVPSKKSEAARYMETGHTYAAREFAGKESVLRSALNLGRFRSVLDIGCNTGYFSVLAARHGARVVAIDRDPDAVGALWRTAGGSDLHILPLVIDIARPPGSCGWANSEFPSFLDRARGKFDGVLMLALVHHLLVNERVPLDRIFELAAALTTNMLIIEYVDPADAQFQRIARGREALHRDLTQNSFEDCARRRFHIMESHEVTPTRRIYVMRKTGA